MTGPEDIPKINSLSQFQSNNYLERLGLSPGASDVEIKKAFRDLAKKVHPDRNPGDSTAEANFKLLNEAYENLKIGITAKTAGGYGFRPSRRDRAPRNPETEQIRRRAEELKTEAADVENFSQGGAIAEKINQELAGTGKQDELLGYLTRRLHFLLQQRIKEHTNLESLAVVAKEVNAFADSQNGRLLFTSFFTDELDVAALNIGLEMLLKANVRQEVDRALAAIAQYPFTFGAISEEPVAQNKDDAIAKIKFLSRIKRIRPQTGDGLDRLASEVNEYPFTDEKRASLYKKQIIDVIERHRNVYYRNGVFTPLKNSEQNPLRSAAKISPDESDK